MNEKKFHWGFVLTPLYALMGVLSLCLGHSRKERFHTVTGSIWLVLAAGWAFLTARDLRKDEEEDDWDSWEEEFES